jgi:hypothetical protein
VIVALHFEDRRIAVADVDHAGILAGAADSTDVSRLLLEAPALWISL